MSRTSCHLTSRCNYVSSDVSYENQIGTQQVRAAQWNRADWHGRHSCMCHLLGLRGGEEPSQAQQRARDLPGGAADVVTVINAGDTVEGPQFVEPPGTNDVPCDR